MFPPSDHYETLYPYTGDPTNAGATRLLTKEQVDSDMFDARRVSAPPVNSVTTVDIFKTVRSEVVVLKVDIEGFECLVCRRFIDL